MHQTLFSACTFFVADSLSLGRGHPGSEILNSGSWRAESHCGSVGRCCLPAPWEGTGGDGGSGRPPWQCRALWTCRHCITWGGLASFSLWGTFPHRLCAGTHQLLLQDLSVVV